jgi:hypothetical protein
VLGVEIGGVTENTVHLAALDGGVADHPGGDTESSRVEDALYSALGADLKEEGGGSGVAMGRGG